MQPIWASEIKNKKAQLSFQNPKYIHHQSITSEFVNKLTLYLTPCAIDFHLLIEEQEVTINVITYVSAKTAKQTG